jgi:hypothetical protein
MSRKPSIDDSEQFQAMTDSLGAAMLRMAGSWRLAIISPNTTDKALLGETVV